MKLSQLWVELLMTNEAEEVIAQVEDVAWGIVRKVVGSGDSCLAEQLAH